MYYLSRFYGRQPRSPSPNKNVHGELKQRPEKPFLDHLQTATSDHFYRRQYLVIRNMSGPSSHEQNGPRISAGYPSLMLPLGAQFTLSLHGIVIGSGTLCTGVW